jgi:hypothetical protein
LAWPPCARRANVATEAIATFTKLNFTEQMGGCGSPIRALCGEHLGETLEMWPKFRIAAILP